MQQLDVFDAIPRYVLLAAIAGVAILVVALIVFLLRRRGPSRAGLHLPAALDVQSLDRGGPPPDGPQLYFYGIPVRLVVFVLAPAGRGSPFPPKEQLRQIVERLVPGLPLILDWHQPVYQQWPEQLSSHGFAQAFFNQLALPGDRGKGTPWCAAAGRFHAGDGYLLAGLVCRADEPNGLGQVVVEHEGQWHDVLRVKRRPE